MHAESGPAERGLQGAVSLPPGDLREIYREPAFGEAQRDVLRADDRRLSVS